MMTKHETQLKAYIDRCNAEIDRAVDEVFLPGSIVSRAAAYTLQNGGKRVRGVLALAACALFDGSMDTAAVYAAAIEMIHAFSLVHDDLPCMDDDDMRRGKPAAHIAFGEANALLAGDLLAIEAFDYMAGAAGDAAGAVRILARAAGAKGMIYGQELDLKYETQPADAAALALIHDNKTGALIKAAAELGLAAAGVKMADAPAVERYITNVGLVFQIVDDILDVTANEAELGKPVGSDAQNCKTTFTSLYGLERAREKVEQLTVEAVDAIKAAYGEKATFLCDYAKQLSRRIM